MKHSLKWNRNKTTRNNFITYGVVILAYVIMQIMSSADALSSTMEGPAGAHLRLCGDGHLPEPDGGRAG